MTGTQPAGDTWNLTFEYPPAFTPTYIDYFSYSVLCGGLPNYCYTLEAPVIDYTFTVFQGAMPTNFTWVDDTSFIFILNGNF